MSSPSSKYISSLSCADQVVSVLQAGFFVLDGQGAILKINPAFSTILGYRPEDIAGRTFADLRHDLSSESDYFKERVDRYGLYYFFQAEKNLMPMIMRHKEGYAVPVRLRSVIIKDESGKPSGGIGIIEKIPPVSSEESKLDTEDVVNRQIWEMEQNYKSILENSGDAIFIADFNSRVITVNAAALYLLGFDSADQVVGKSVVELGPLEGAYTSATGDVVTFSVEYQDRQTAAANELFETGKAYSELYFFKNDGTVVPVEATLSLLKDKRGERRGTITVCRDITERKLAERQVQAAHDALEEKVKERTRNLEEANTALRVLVQGRDDEKLDMEKKLISNINELVLPYLEKLRDSRLDDRQHSYLEIAGTNLQDVLSPFSQKLSTRFLKLTPAEIQVANLIKQGKTSKQIATILSLSKDTIETHRKHIRNKLGLQNRKANLRTYLLSLD